MARTQNVADGITTNVKCPKCGHKTEKALSWFEGKDVLACDSCGHGIDLKVEPNYSRIKERLREAARVQTALTEAGNRY